MRENRVRVRDYGSLPRDSPRLVPVASTSKPPQRLHWAAAAAFEDMRKAALAAGHDLKIVSGWRPKKTESRGSWNARMAARYGSVSQARKWRAYSSPHETGLAFDLGTEGLSPTSATAAAQRGTAVYQWLSENASRYGVTPYLAEPWHWEVNIPRRDWDRTSEPPNLLLLVGFIAVGAAVLVGYWVNN